MLHMCLYFFISTNICIRILIEESRWLYQSNKTARSQYFNTGLEAKFV